MNLNAITTKIKEQPPIDFAGKVVRLYQVKTPNRMTFDYYRIMVQTVENGDIINHFTSTPKVQVNGTELNLNEGDVYLFNGVLYTKKGVDKDGLPTEFLHVSNIQVISNLSLVQK